MCSRDTGAAAVTVVRAWAVAMAVSGADEVWDAIGTSCRAPIPPLPPAAEARCWFALEAAVERATKWIVETQPHDEPAADLSDMLAASTRELLQVLPEVLPASAREQLDATVEALAADGTPRGAGGAHRVARSARRPLRDRPRSRASSTCHAPWPRRRTTASASVVDLDWVRRSLGELPAEDRWERRAHRRAQRGADVRAAPADAQRLCTCTAAPAPDVDACLQEYVAAPCSRS